MTYLCHLLDKTLLSKLEIQPSLFLYYSEDFYFFLPVLLCQEMAVRCEQIVNKMKDHLPVISISVQRFQRIGVQILQQTVTQRYRRNSAKVKPSPAH